MSRETLEEMIEYTKKHLPILNKDGTPSGIGRGRAVLPAYDLLKLLNELKNWREYGQSSVR